MKPANTNAYAPPDSATTSADAITSGPWRVVRARGGWLARTLRITGPVDCTLHYQAWAPTETVRIDGTLVATKFNVDPFQANFVWPRMEFLLGGHASAIMARAWPWPWLSCFTLYVDDALVYAEGDLSQLPTSGRTGY